MKDLTLKTPNNELIYFSSPIEIEMDDETGLVYSYKDNLYFESEIESFLSNALYLMGITKKKDKAKFKLEVKIDKEDLKHTLFYEKCIDPLDFDGELDKEFLNHAFKVTTTIIDTINSINQCHSKNKVLIPRYDPDITELFKINDDEVIYQNKKSLVLINDFLNLQPKLSKEIVIGSMGINIPLINTTEFAPPLKKKSLSKNKIAIEGNIAAIQYFPCRKIKIKISGDYPQRIQSFEITKSCCNFSNFIKMKENAAVSIMLELSSTTEQYNIIEFEDLEQNQQTLENLFDDSGGDN